MIAAVGALVLVFAGEPFYSPRITQVAPAGGQRGVELVVAFLGQRLAEPQELMFTDAGIMVVALRADKPERCEATLRIAPDCPLGPHGLRLRTAAGISNYVWFQVGALPEADEKREGDAAMRVALEHTINASLRGEEIDRYAVDLQAGARVHCEVMAMRLGFSAVDLALSVASPDGHELARIDDTALGQKDPFVTFTAEASGTYVVAVEAAFPDAANSGPYRLHLGTFPRPTGALPAGGQPGETIEFELLGDGPATRARATLPADGTQIHRYYPAAGESETAIAPSPILLRVGGPPNANGIVDAKGRTLVEFPASVHGVIAGPDQTVRYFFKAKKGQVLEFRALARTLRSPLDPVLIAREAGGKFLAYNDDAGGGGGGSADSLLTFTAPADGEFSIEVRDLLRRGSPAHFFRLEGSERSAPMNLRMVVGRQDEPVLAVPQGGRGACVLQISNADANAGLELLAQDLPPGVTASFGPILRGSNLVPLVLHASQETSLLGAQMGFEARATKAPLARDPGYVQVIPLVTVRNNQPILYAAQRRLPVAVTKAAPFTLELEPLTAPLVRGAPMGVRVRVQREKGFADNIRIRALWTPPGVNAGQVVIPGKSSEAVLPIEATTTAMLGAFPLAVNAVCSRGGGALELASDFTELRVEEPWVTATVGKARGCQGEGKELRVQLERKHALEVPYRAVLLNLPRGVTATEAEVAPDATEVTFALTIAADAPPGRHRAFAVELRVPAGEGIALHRFGGGEIRVDPRAATTARTGR